MFRFLHAADIHLDSPLVGLDRYESAPVDAVRSATRRAFENLVRNAREAAGEGGHVWMAGARDGDAVAVTVADDGPGLPSDARPQMVRPFSTTKAGGLGLGLPIAVKIVGLHGGDLILGDRQSAEGLAVTVRLPVAGPSRT